MSYEKWTQGRYQKNLHNYPSNEQKWINRYNFSSEEIQQMNRNNDDLFEGLTIDLSIARPISNPLVINMYGRGLFAQSVPTGAVYNPVTNSGIESNPAAIRTSLILVWFNDTFPQPDKMFPLKQGRRFNGEFKKITICNPTFGARTMRIFIWKWDGVQPKYGMTDG